MSPTTPTAPDRRNRLHALEAEVRARYAEAARSLWHIGQCVLEVQQSELWREDGLPTFGAWLDSDRVPLGRASAYKALRIAEHFSSETASRFGTEKLDAAVGYLKATRKDEQPGDLLALNVRLRGDDGAWTSVPFVDATTGQIREAMQLMGHGQRDARVPAEVQGRVERLNRAIPQAGGAWQGAKVNVRRNRAGRVVLAMHGVPVDDLEGFLAMVREHFGR